MSEDERNKSEKDQALEHWLEKIPDDPGWTVEKENVSRISTSWSSTKRREALVMQKYLLGFLIYTICLVSGTSVQARITQSIDRQEISAGETFVLDIQIDKDIDVQTRS